MFRIKIEVDGEGVRKLHELRKAGGSGEAPVPLTAIFRCASEAIERKSRQAEEIGNEAGGERFFQPGIDSIDCTIEVKL